MPPAADDLASQIMRLKSLKDQGVLTDEEFQKAKQKLLFGSTSKPGDAGHNRRTSVLL